MNAYLITKVFKVSTSEPLAKMLVSQYEVQYSADLRWVKKIAKYTIQYYDVPTQVP